MGPVGPTGQSASCCFAFGAVGRCCSLAELFASKGVVEAHKDHGHYLSSDLAEDDSRWVEGDRGVKDFRSPEGRRRRTVKFDLTYGFCMKPRPGYQAGVKARTA